MSTDQGGDMTEPYTPSLDEIVMGKTHMGDNFWRDLTEDEVRRGVEAVRAEAWDEGYGAGWDDAENYHGELIPEFTHNPHRRETP